MKRWIWIALALILTIPSAASAANTAMGRYVEYDLSLPEGLINVCGMGLNGAGEIEICAVRENGVVLLTRGADGSWREEAPAWAPAMAELDGLADFTAAGNEVWALRYGDESNGYRPRVCRGADGTLTEVNWKELEDVFYERIAATEEGYVALRIYEEGLRVFSASTGRECCAAEGYDGEFLLRGKTLTALSNEELRAAQFDMETGETLWEMDDAPVTGNDALAVDGDSVYIANAGGVYRAAQGGSLWEKLMDGALSSLRTPDTSFRGLAILEGDPVLLLSDSEGKLRLVRCAYDPNIPTLPENELRVYTLSENRLLSQAASQFQAAHPDYIVNISALLQEGATASDVIRALNAELLAGEGPDILLLDGMPMNSYVEKGVLADLSPAIDPMLQEGALIGGLFEAFRDADGHIYAAPGTVSLPVALGAAGVTIPRSLDELSAAAQNGGAQRALGKRTVGGLFDMLLPGSYTAWFNADGALDEEIFAAFLRSLAAISERCGVEEDPYEDELHAAIFSFEAPNNAMNMMGGRLNELVDMKNGSLMLYPMMLSGLNFQMTELTALSDMGGAMDELPGQAEDVFVPAGLLGVNARSAHADAALDFVRIALSDAVQSLDSYAGLPVNSKSFEALVARETSRFETCMSTTDSETGVSIELNGRWPVAALRERAYELISAAKTAYIPDEELLGLIKTELKPFFEGRADAQSAAASVAARARAYLAE